MYVGKGKLPDRLGEKPYEELNGELSENWRNIKGKWKYVYDLKTIKN